MMIWIMVDSNGWAAPELAASRFRKSLSTF